MKWIFYRFLYCAMGYCSSHFQMTQNSWSSLRNPYHCSRNTFQRTEMLVFCNVGMQFPFLHILNLSWMKQMRNISFWTPTLSVPTFAHVEQVNVVFHFLPLWQSEKSEPLKTREEYTALITDVDSSQSFFSNWMDILFFGFTSVVMFKNEFDIENMCSWWCSSS